ncbi:MAG: hypothetical protein ABSD51_12700, partial [Candidatus Binatus sp.]
MAKIISTRSIVVASKDQISCDLAGRTPLAHSPAKPLMKSTLAAYLAMLVRVSRWHLIGVLIVMVLYSLTEGVGFALLLPTLQMAGFNLAGQGEAGRYAAIVSNAFVAVGLRPSLILLLGVFVMLVGARTVLG